MPDIYLFLKIIVPVVWGILAGGALLGLAEIASRFSPAIKRHLDAIPEEMRRTLEVILLCGAILYAGYAAWSDEHTQRVRLDKELAEVREKVDRARMPDGNLLYQDGRAIGSISRFSYERTNHTVVFRSVSATGRLDFSKRVMFRDAVLHCRVKSPREFSFGDYYSMTYSDLSCDVFPSDAQLD